jgi:subtilisin family serine protease
VGASDENGNRASFSQYGNGVDIFAPGTNIYSTWVNNGYNSIPGTSMASPIVAGIAGLLKAVKPNLSALEIESLLKSSATSMGDTSSYGAGRVNACKAIAAALGNNPVEYCDNLNTTPPNPPTPPSQFSCIGTFANTTICS